MAKAKKKTGTGVPIKEFAEAVVFARAFAAGDKATVDAGASRSLHFGDGRLWTRSGSTWIVRSIALPTLTESFAVPADALAKAVQAVEAQGPETPFTLALDKSALAWRGGAAKGRIALDTEATAVSPDVPATAVPVGGELAAAFARVQFAAYRGEQWPMLRGVYWGGDGRVMASDGDRLVAVQIDTKCPRPNGVLVPDHLLRAMKSFPMSHADVTDNLVIFGNETTTVAGVLLHAEFPHERIASSLEMLSKAAQAGELTRVDLESAQPVKALLQAAAASTEAPLHAVTVSVRAGGLDVQAGRGGDEVRVELHAKVAGVDRQCRINAQYLTAAVEQGFPLYFGDKCLYTADDERRFEHAAMYFAS